MSVFKCFFSCLICMQFTVGASEADVAMQMYHSLFDLVPKSYQFVDLGFSKEEHALFDKLAVENAA